MWRYGLNDLYHGSQGHSYEDWLHPSHCLHWSQDSWIMRSCYRQLLHPITKVANLGYPLQQARLWMPLRTRCHDFASRLGRIIQRMPIQNFPATSGQARLHIRPNAWACKIKFHFNQRVHTTKNCQRVQDWGSMEACDWCATLEWSLEAKC